MPHDEKKLPYWAQLKFAVLRGIIGRERERGDKYKAKYLNLKHREIRRDRAKI